jgi:hypothetical protein
MERIKRALSEHNFTTGRGLRLIQGSPLDKPNVVWLNQKI